MTDPEYRQALYPAEVLGYQARAKGLAFLGIVTQVASCINTFGLPVALDKIGWKVYLIFCIWDLFECVVIWFMMVETKVRYSRFRLLPTG